MIIPAGIFKIIGFINKESNSLEETPQKGNLLLVYSDSGKKVILKLTGNKPNLTEEDIKLYIDKKIESVIKEKEINIVASELEYLEEIELEIEELSEKLKEEGKDRKEIIAFKKEYKKNKAKELVFERRRIKKGSILRLAISFSDKLEKYKFQEDFYPVLTSRCIIFDNEGNPLPTGMYYFAQTLNQIPITIKPIFNKEKEALNLFQLEISKLATVEHLTHFIGHIERTLEKSLKDNGKAYLVGINYDYEKIKDKEVFQLVKKINEIAKIKESTNINEYISLLKELLSYFEKDNSLIIDIQIKLNLLLTKNFFIDMPDSPFEKLNKTFVDLNFSKLDPPEKNKLKEILENKKREIKLGEYDCSINAVYHTPAIKLDEPSQSWGFMPNNIQQESLILSSKDSTLLIKKIT